MRYKKEIYEKAEKELYQSRKKAKENLELRKLFLYKRFPQVKELEKELALTAVKAAKAVVRGANAVDELKRLKIRNLELQGKIKEIVRKCGFSDDYLDIKYKCDKCGDQGFVDGIMCDCMKKLIKKHIYDELNKLSPLSLSTFDTFSLNYYSDIPIRNGEQSPRERMDIIYRFCVNYADNFSANSKSVIMRGGTGLGKTHLSLAIANTVINNGFNVIYISAPNLVSYMEKNRFKEMEASDGIREHVIDCDLLIIDDLGSEFSTQFSNATIYNIVNSRILMLKPTIISTNLSIKEIEKMYTERMVSRIIGDNIRLEFIGDDIRQKKRLYK